MKVPSVLKHWVTGFKDVLWKDSETTRSHLTHLHVYPWGSYATDGYLVIRTAQGSARGNWRIARELLDDMAKIKGELVLEEDGTIKIGSAVFRAQPLPDDEDVDLDHLFGIDDQPVFRIGFSLSELEKLLKVAKRIKAETRDPTFCLLFSFFGPERAAYVQLATSNSKEDTVADALIMPIKTSPESFQDPEPWAKYEEAK
ncbi:MAG: hypothetical protein DRJ03_05290 [Chloroflexi bacterium]|nr:MAG: hypothetical protein DRJ03_05290 [Chloroflexota bacterium]